MSTNEHNFFRENIPAYAIGALDVEDIATLESHLQTCTSCQAELAEFRALSDGLLQALPPKNPSAQLRRRLTSNLPAHRQLNQAPRPVFFNRFSPSQIAATSFIVILLIINFYANLQIRNLQQQQAALAEQLRKGQESIAMLAYPNTQTLTVSADVRNLTGSVLVDKTQDTAVFFLWNLPQLESTQTYQAWLVDTNGNRISGGLFSVAAGQGYTSVTIKAPSPLKNFIRIGVTVEPQGGSPKPTGQRVFVVNL